MAAKDKARQWLQKAHLLKDALPFLQRYEKRSIIVKFGGNVMGDIALTKSFAEDIVVMKQAGFNPVVVHGGGPQIGEMLERLQIESKFSNGLRITDDETIGVVEMVLAGKINKELVGLLHKAGGRALGISGKDGNLIRARKKKQPQGSHLEKATDLGFVGEPIAIDAEILRIIQDKDFIPVIAPIAYGDDDVSLNINADIAAGAIASELNAERLLLLTDIEGVLDEKGTLLENLTIKQAEALIDNGTAKGGMIPKLETAIKALQSGVTGVAILDGRKAHAVSHELFTKKGAGTLIEKQ
ncbi:MAG: acetylglutamate kinase [Parvibaculales bacterium]